jgi:hypothetical protein
LLLEHKQINELFIAVVTELAQRLAFFSVMIDDIISFHHVVSLDDGQKVVHNFDNGIWKEHEHPPGFSNLVRPSGDEKE